MHSIVQIHGFADLVQRVIFTDAQCPAFASNTNYVSFKMILLWQSLSDSVLPNQYFFVHGDSSLPIRINNSVSYGLQKAAEWVRTLTFNVLACQPIQLRLPWRWQISGKRILWIMSHWGNQDD